MKGQFNEKIPAHREQQHLSLRRVVALLERDKAQGSKIEKGQRHLKKEQIPLLAEILKADKDELITLWLADQVFDVIKDESMADEALKSVSRKIKKKK